MSPEGFLLVLAAALCHATWNLLVKRLNAGAELLWLFSLVTVILYAPFALWAVLRWEDPSPLAALAIALSTALHLGYFLVLQAGYRAGDLSMVYPTARATGPILSGVLAVLLLGEEVNGTLILGAGVIVFGVFMLTGGFRRRSRAAALSLAFGLATGAFIGSYTIADAYAVTALAIPPLLVDYASSLGRVVLLAPLANRRRDRVAALWRDHRAEVTGIAIFSALAYILVLVAITFTPVVYVAPLRETSVLFAVLAGSLLLGEGDLARRLGWAAVIFAGVVLLATS
ncbi:EamA family transporter [Litorisediminicola beolgyonensis]|uniref:EamA family transporter n=1 Tax=Litorisediminicola beolgyonensis TaxID=1173614 RepID=A0ABW3ZN87_9RHOB